MTLAIKRDCWEDLYMKTGLKGRPILVTGASGGIGAATVRMLIQEGADVIASGRNTDLLDDLARETGCRTRPFDLTDEADVAQALDGLELYGVVNCGGWGGVRPLGGALRFSAS